MVIGKPHIYSTINNPLCYSAGVRRRALVGVFPVKAKLLFRPGIVVINLPQHIRGRQPTPRPLPW
ncbi:hypothetical protein [Ktedonobacter racemifer]|uniref:hypothetical protein n=1 Tax=Ktedonobacter racemifer TaxID=363277 RepID=UPI0012F711DB|nr:hypothetical protein [Ktedonobacter racemifer]